MKKSILNILIVSFFLALISCANKPVKTSKEISIKDALKQKTLKDGNVVDYIDFKVIDQIIKRIAIHAKNYPPHFNNIQQKQKVEMDLKSSLYILDTLLTKETKDPRLLLRIGILQSMGHNLDFPGSDMEAIRAYEQLLRYFPNHPEGNYYYGLFLANTAKFQAESIIYLEKSLKLGVVDSMYTLGIMYLKFGKDKQGIELLNNYAKLFPKSPAIKIIEGFKEGRLKFHKSN